MLYKAGPKNFYFTYTMFFVDLLRGFVHSLVLFFSVIGVVAWGGAGGDGKDQGDLATIGLMLGFSCVMIVNVNLMTEIKHFTWAHYVALLIGPLAFLFLFGIIYGFSDFLPGMEFQSTYYGSFNRAFQMPDLWYVHLLLLLFSCSRSSPPVFILILILFSFFTLQTTGVAHTYKPPG